MTAAVHVLRPPGSSKSSSQEDARAVDAALVTSLTAGHPEAPSAFFDRYGAYVERLIVRLIGFDAEVEDLLHEVFAESLEKIGQLRDPAALRPWLTRITVFTARNCLRRRTRGRWLSFHPPEDLPDIPSAPDAGEARQTLQRVYGCLKQVKADDRIAFTLHVLHQMTLTESAEACGVSLATVKRRIARGRERFMHAAGKDPVLMDRLQTGGDEWQA